jgi:putative solute:sodium symporter small subunit
MKLAESGEPDNRRGSYWRSNLRLVLILLSIWFAVPFGLGIVFVEELNQFHMGGFPVGFWFAQQGSIYVFFVLVLIYAFAMRRLDRAHGVG